MCGMYLGEHNEGWGTSKGKEGRAPWHSWEGKLWEGLSRRSTSFIPFLFAKHLDLPNITYGKANSRDKDEETTDNGVLRYRGRIIDSLGRKGQGWLHLNHQQV